MTHCISQITFVGQIRTISTQATNITYKLDDGTGLIEVKQWIDSDADPARGGEAEVDRRAAELGAAAPEGRGDVVEADRADDGDIPRHPASERRGQVVDRTAEERDDLRHARLALLHALAQDDLLGGEPGELSVGGQVALPQLPGLHQEPPEPL